MNITELNLNLDSYESSIKDIKPNQSSIIVSTPFLINSLSKPYKFNTDDKKKIDYINKVLTALSNKLKNGGILFVYGIPQELPYYANFLDINSIMKFKYWIALEIGDIKKTNGLICSHLGILMYVKGEKAKFHLNTKKVRIPYTACSACLKNIKDWGGKKHLINKKGSALSDVWKDFYKVTGEVDDQYVEDLKLKTIEVSKKRIKLNSPLIPNEVKNRLIELVNIDEPITIVNCNFESNLTFDQKDNNIKDKVDSITQQPECDIYFGDCIEVMQKWVEQYPEGCFDLIFADPPYNLDKDYDNYSDTEIGDDYIQWCDQWLELSAKLLKPNGSLLVLNLPKWSINHAITLNKVLYLQNWIVWDALSTPKGKIMPAHYSLLYYTKSKDQFTFNSEYTEIDSPEYCLRASCIKKRKKNSINNKVKLNDIWSDIHRIKHKKDRDDHPCQLPDKLMERIILMFSNKDDYVFDPFSGAGTTPVIANKLKRKYAAIDLSQEYVKIAKRKIQEIETWGNVIKDSIKKEKHSFTKKEIEIYVQKVCTKLGYKPDESEFIEILRKDKSIDFNKDDISHLFGDVKTALKSGRIAILNQTEIDFE